MKVRNNLALAHCTPTKLPPLVRVKALWDRVGWGLGSPVVEAKWAKYKPPRVYSSVQYQYVYLHRERLIKKSPKKKKGYTLWLFGQTRVRSRHTTRAVGVFEPLAHNRSTIQLSWPPLEEGRCVYLPMRSQICVGSSLRATSAHPVYI